MLYWCNLPTDVLRPGVCGVDTWDIVDIDEFGRYTSAASPHTGHSIIGTCCRELGKEKRGDLKITGCVAVDRRVGVIKSLLYSTGTSSDVFLLFMEFVLIPPLLIDIEL